MGSYKVIGADKIKLYKMRRDIFYPSHHIVCVYVGNAPSSTVMSTMMNVDLSHLNASNYVDVQCASQIV